jgi:1-acyl-sn-glycerol-3-phosphate acyltransferase
MYRRRLKARLPIKDPFGNILLVKRLIMLLIGLVTYAGMNIINRLKVEGAEHLKNLPDKNVLFVSNHQTYFADVFALFHIFSATKWHFLNINLPVYLLWPRVKSYYIAAAETMLESGWLPRFFTYAGGITIKRNWRRAGQDIQGGADLSAPIKIKKALSFGWVITFPQGTTTPNAPVRKGTDNIIKSYRPIVVPVHIEGLREAFDKKGLRIRKAGSRLRVRFLPPVQFDADTTAAEIQQFLEAHLLGAGQADA